MSDECRSRSRVPEVEIWRSARVMIKEYGEDAPVRAALKADAMLAAGDRDGRSVWRHIHAAIEMLLMSDTSGQMH